MIYTMFQLHWTWCLEMKKQTTIPLTTTNLWFDSVVLNWKRPVYLHETVYPLHVKSHFECVAFCRMAWRNETFQHGVIKLCPRNTASHVACNYNTAWLSRIFFKFMLHSVTGWHSVLLPKPCSLVCESQNMTGDVKSSKLRINTLCL